MKFTNLLSSSAAVAVAAFALGLALPAFAVAAVAFLVLIVAHDYAPRRLDYTAIAVAHAERLPYAA